MVFTYLAYGRWIEKDCNRGYHNNNNNSRSSDNMALSGIISASRGTALAPAMEMGSDDAGVSCAHMHTHTPMHGDVFTLQSSER
ncbi:hypothetical protein EYF80_003868 [Liparis tanakae]|uniref:Uncharacterized protein n=1 Tax=Liparis tanakae TaxID=230148 RepID=A0A4Z2J7Z1_9TELE|nr:hypothetical protein EYF80_003868 [Liparis tanakae]